VTTSAEKPAPERLVDRSGKATELDQAPSITGFGEEPIEEVAGAFANLRYEAPISSITRKVLVPATLSIPRSEIDATIALCQDNCRRLSGKIEYTKKARRLGDIMGRSQGRRRQWRGQR
jgi:hypothetical protein